eukprot:3281619-Prymnesium_polylepis.1
MFTKACMPPEMLCKMVKFCNQRLSGVCKKGDNLNRYTTMGEIVRLLGYMGTVAQNQHLPRRRLWEVKQQEEDIAAPMNLGQYGMGVNRFEKLLNLIWQYWEYDENNLDKSDPSRY